MKKARSTTCYRPKAIQLYQLHILGIRVLDYIEYKPSASEMVRH